MTALIFGGLCLPARAGEVIRLFAPVPAGKVAPLVDPSAPRTALSPSRTILVPPAPAIRGSLSEDGHTARPVSPAAEVQWRTAPQSARRPPPTADWQSVAPSSSAIIRNAAR